MPDKKYKYKPEEYIDECPFCGSKRRQKLFKDEDMGFVCLGCGAGFKKIRGKWLYDSTLNQPVTQLPRGKNEEENNNQKEKGNNEDYKHRNKYSRP